MADKPRLEFRADIEGLRGIAVLLVVLYHAGVPFLHGGFAGVDVFFVVSGYLITRLVVDEATRAGRVHLAAFYARRARRLLPAAGLTVLVTLAAGWFVLAPLTHMNVARTGLAAATYWSNLYFAVEAGDYFGQDLSRNPLLHTWSLAVEEQFYLIWPLLAMIGVWLSRRRRGGLIALLLVVVAVSFVANLLSMGPARHWAFFGMHTRAWEFGVGGLAGLVTLGTWRESWVGAALSWSGLAMIIASGVLVTEAMPWPGTLATVPVVGAALVLPGGAVAPSSVASRALGSRLMRVLGRLSYSWYLWHWPALVLVEAAAGPLGPGQRLVVAVGSLLLSWVTHTLVENPVRFHPRLVASARRSLRVMLFTTGGVVVLASVADVVARSAGALQERFLAASRDLPRSVADGCNLAIPIDAPASDCVYGQVGSETTVVLLGDSHATQWFPAIERLALENAWRLVVHTKSGCTLADVDMLLPSGEAFPTCTAWREAVLSELEASKPDLVIAATYAAHQHTAPREWSTGLAWTLRRLAGAARTVVYVKDTPTPGFDVPECLSRWAGRTAAFRQATCGFDLSEGLAGHAWELEALDAAGVPVLDLGSVICLGTWCEVERGGMVVFRDSHHLTAEYAASLAQAFIAGIREELGSSLALNRK